MWKKYLVTYYCRSVPPKNCIFQNKFCESCLLCVCFFKKKYLIVSSLYVKHTLQFFQNNFPWVGSWTIKLNSANFSLANIYLFNFTKISKMLFLFVDIENECPIRINLENRGCQMPWNKKGQNALLCTQNRVYLGLLYPLYGYFFRFGERSEEASLHLIAHLNLFMKNPFNPISIIFTFIINICLKFNKKKSAV